jgi:NAD-dependent deacetylase
MKRPSRVFILTGAGVSAESGVPTFRDANGLWEGHRFEDVATPSAWRRDPLTVWRFYTLRRRALLNVKPNAAHVAVARLQAEGPQSLLVSQNVDDLHQRAGSASVLSMHGQLRSLRCEASGRCEERMAEDDLHEGHMVTCTCCAAPSRMRPDVVWFGETPLGMPKIHDWIGRLSDGDLCLVVGTSGHVFPAADLARQARQAGARTVLVNLDEPLNAGDFDEVHLGPAGKLLPGLVDTWLEAWSADGPSV